MNYNQVINSVPMPNFKQELVKKYQSTSDIIADLFYCFKIYNFQAANVANIFKTGNFNNDARKLYDFTKNNIEYEAEPFDNQTTRSFSRIIHDKKGDCKHTALLESSIAHNMGYDVIIRFASYEKSKKLGHVYAILQDPKTLQQIIVDPLQAFNYEKPYTSKKDFLIKNNTDMSLSRLSGTGEMMPIGKLNVKNIVQKIVPATKIAKPLINVIAPKAAVQLTDLDKKVLPTPVTTIVKAALNPAQPILKAIAPKKAAALKPVEAKVDKTVVAVSVAPMRAAFLVLLDMNFLGMAQKFNILFQHGEKAKVQKFWEQFGGDMNKFENAVKNGITWRNLHRLDDDKKVLTYNDPKLQQSIKGVPYPDGFIGYDPATIAAAADVAVATPITTATGGFLASFSGAVATALAAVTVIAADVTKGKKAVDDFKAAVIPAKVIPGVTPPDFTTANTTATQNLPAAANTFYEKNKTAIIGVGGLLALFAGYKIYKSVKN
jgi:hypothetical protein